MPGAPKPPEGSYSSPEGTYRNYPLADDIDQSSSQPGRSQNFRNVNVFKCTPEQSLRNIKNAIEELYKNFDYTFSSPAFLNVRNDSGTVTVNDVSELVAGCMNVEDLGGNLARISPKTAQFFQAPAGGIAAMTTATVPSATCTKLEIQSGVMKTTSQTATVYNAGGSAISANAIFMAHPIVPGCIYGTMSCCENTGISLGSGGPGGSTDPPDPPGGGSGDCASLTPGTNIYNQYDISLYGFYEDLTGQRPDAPCYNCILDDSEPYVIRVTNIGNKPIGELFFDRPPCGLDVSCPWKGIDNNPTTPPSNPFAPYARGCEVVRCFMGLAKFRPQDDPLDGLTFCFANGSFTEEDMANPTGLYLWVYVDVGYTNQFLGYFVKKVDQDHTSTFDMDLTDYEIDLTWNRGGRTACLPKTSDLVPEASQGRCYIKINKVASGGLLSV